ncbi:MAG: hypothetical protein KDD15_33440, partial [Lewinella sp.]|nr:hypothetical protein [Lewinella sp.]
CIFSLSLGGYCIIDTILLTIMATIGATGAYMFITYALKTILNFFSNIAKIISIPSEQLTDIIMNQSNESSNSA